MKGIGRGSDSLSKLRGTVIGEREANYRTILLAYGNPDYRQDPNELFCNSLTVFGDSIEDLSQEERKWIRSNRIGSGNFTRAYVWNNRKGHESEIVGILCYNGKFMANKT